MNGQNRVESWVEVEELALDKTADRAGKDRCGGRLEIDGSKITKVFFLFTFFLCEIPAKNICYVLASLGNSERVGTAAIDNGREKIWIPLKYRSIKDPPEGACHSSIVTQASVCNFL